jgi:folate-dependent phosphoribosylglycinamide formyltransferase PurN
MRIVILTYESLYANYMTHRLIQARPGQVVGIVRSDCLIPGKSLPEALWYILRRSGVRFVGRKGLELLQSRALAILFRIAGRERKVPSLREIKSHYGLPIVGSEDVNSPETMEVLRSWQPELVISIYLNQLIKPDLIHLPSLGCLNIHPALLPRNRGLFPYFWAMVNGDNESGITLHWVDEKFDTGEILLQEVISIGPDDTLTSLQYRSAQVGADMLVRGVDLVEAGDPPRIQQDTSQASYYSWPRPTDRRRFRQRGRDYGTIFELMRYM